MHEKVAGIGNGHGYELYRVIYNSVDAIPANAEFAYDHLLMQIVPLYAGKIKNLKGLCALRVLFKITGRLFGARVFPISIFGTQNKAMESRSHPISRASIIKRRRGDVNKKTTRMEPTGCQKDSFWLRFCAKVNSRKAMSYAQYVIGHSWGGPEQASAMRGAGRGTSRLD